jgi:hypothetical protein
MHDAGRYALVLSSPINPGPNAIEQCRYCLLVEPLGLCVIGQVRHLRRIERVEHGVADAAGARPLRMQLGLSPQIEGLRCRDRDSICSAVNVASFPSTSDSHGERPRADWSTM